MPPPGGCSAPHSLCGQRYAKPPCRISLFLTTSDPLAGGLCWCGPGETHSEPFQQGSNMISGRTKRKEEVKGHFGVYWKSYWVPLARTPSHLPKRLNPPIKPNLSALAGTGGMKTLVPWVGKCFKTLLHRPPTMGPPLLLATEIHTPGSPPESLLF